MNTKPALLATLLALSACSTASSPPPLFPAAYDPEPENRKALSVGAVEIVELPTNVAPNPTVGNKSVVEVQRGANPRQFKVIPLKKGTSSVIFYSEDGMILERTLYSIISSDLSMHVITIRRLLAKVEGISVEPVDDKIVIDGALMNPHDLDRILQVQEAYRQHVLNLVTINPIVYERRAQLMQREITADPGAANVVVKFVNGTYFLLGQVDSSGDSERAEIIVQAYLPEIMGSTAIRENWLTVGAKKYSIRNLLYIKEHSAGRAPASP